MCVIPVMPTTDDGLKYAVGLAYCSETDYPVKAKGRRIAEARARAAIEATDDIKWKPMAQFMNNEGRLCGILTSPKYCVQDARDMEVSETVLSRLQKTFDYLEMAIIEDGVVS
jgi:hypothetical protein